MSTNRNKNLVEQFKTVNKEDPEFVKQCAQVVEDINQDSFTFLQVIEYLGSLLTDTTPTNRELGMLILTQVLELIPHNKIIPAQLSHVCNFYADRLKDHHQVIPPTLKGILALLSFEHLPDGCTRIMLNSLFQNVACQQQQQRDRLNIFKTLEVSLENRLTELQEMGFDFIYGVISAVDGERDPRNLFFLFTWLPKFLKQFALGHLSEEMFEVLACYFPVDFRAPPQDPNSISRDTLASALSQCLCGSSEFSEYCLPLMLEKLSSSLSIAKLDSLHVLAKGCEIFPVCFYTQHSTDIWSQIQREVLNNNDDELVRVALQTLTIVMNKLSQNPDNIYKPILSDIIDTVKGSLTPNMKLFNASCKILQHVAKSSKIAVNFVVNEIVPLMLNTFNITLTQSHQVLILQILVDFVCIHRDVYNGQIIENSHLALVPRLCLKASMQSNDELQTAGFMCLSQIAKLLPFDIRECLYADLCLSLISNHPYTVRYAMLDLFRCIAEIYSDEVQDNILNNITIRDNSNLYWYLQSLAEIVQNEKFTEFALSIYVKYCETDLETTIIAIDCLRQLLERYVDDKKIQVYLDEKSQIVFKLTNLVINCLNTIDTNNQAHQQLLCNISIILKLIISLQSSQVQSYIPAKFAEIISIYRNCNKTSLIVIIDGLISCLRRDIKFQLDLMDLINLAFNSDEFIYPIAVQLLANIINKNEDCVKLDDDLSSLMTCLDNLSPIKVERVVKVVSWVTKALLMRGHSKGAAWTKKLVTLLEGNEEAAKGFEIIMKEECAALNEKSFCNIKVLYRQKFFMKITSILTHNYKDESKNYLLAFGYILKEAPRQVFIMQFTKIIKIVLLCLEKCEDGVVLSVILDTLCDLIENTESCTEEYIQELLLRFVSLSTFKSSMNVRMKSLKCIQHFATGYPLYKLLPLKQDIIQGLTVCLDDKKRLVRKAAVEARLSWILLDAPT